VTTVGRSKPYLIPSISNILSPNERILLIGSRGWFGRTALEMFKDNKNLLLISSSQQMGYEVWSHELVKRFQPTIVLNFAFLTRDKVGAYGREEYIRINSTLIERISYVGNLPSVRHLMTISSGASLSAEAQDGLDSKEIYGALKRVEEEVAMSCVATDKSVAILRTFSVSGPYFGHSNQYAFSSFIQQAIEREEIEVFSKSLVFRRYVSVGDLLAVGLQRLISGWSGIIESGGQLVELGELALIVSNYLGVPMIERKLDNRSPINNYYSTDGSWEESLKETAYVPLSLLEQVQVVHEYISSESRHGFN